MALTPGDGLGTVARLLRRKPLRSCEAWRRAAQVLRSSSDNGTASFALSSGVALAAPDLVRSSPVSRGSSRSVFGSAGGGAVQQRPPRPSFGVVFPMSAGDSRDLQPPGCASSAAD